MAVHHRQLFNLVLLKDLGCCFQVCRLICYDQVFLRHHLVDRTVHVSFKTKVTVGNDSDQITAFIHNRYTADLIFCHHSQRIGHTFSLRDCYGIIDHSVFSTLNALNLLSLFCDRHVLMNNTDTTFAGNSDCHLCLGNRIHSGRYHRDIQCNVS